MITQNKTILAQGAEAILTLEKNIIKKHRIKKSYRLSILDDGIRTRRTRNEAKLLEKASKLIPIPKIIKVDEKQQTIELEYIKGKKLSEHLDTLKNNLELCKIIGKQIALLHNHDIIHSDLTTSNMILEDSPAKPPLQPSSSSITHTTSHSDLSNNYSQKLYFIDFGLSFISKKIEDKAVDLHLIKQALEAKHFTHFEKFFNAIIEAYKQTSSQAEQILERLKKVEQRGRYKERY